MDDPDPLGINFMPSSYGTIDPQLGFPYDDHDPTYSDYIMPSSFDVMCAHQLSSPQPRFLHLGLLDNGQALFNDGDCHDADLIRLSPPPPASKSSQKQRQPTPPHKATAATTFKGASTRRAAASAKKPPKRPSPDSPDSSSERLQAPRKSERSTRATARKQGSSSATTTSISTKPTAPSAATANTASDSLDEDSQADSPSSDPTPPSSKREQSLRRNRIAASKCRQKKKEQQSNLETRKGKLESKNSALVCEYTELLAEATAIKNTLMSHASCQDASIDTWIKKEACRFVGRAAQERMHNAPPADDYSCNSSTVFLSPGSSASAELRSPLTPPAKKERPNYDFMPDDMFTEVNL